MIATKLIIQTVLGLGAVAGVVGGGYMMMDNSQDYTLIVSVKHKTTTDPATTELRTAETTPAMQLTKALEGQTASTPKAEDTKPKKNYKCTTGNQKDLKNDESCELYSITFDSGKKSINLTKLNQEVNKKPTTLKADLENTKFFVLKASSTLFSKWTFDGKQEITLVSNAKTGAEKAKSYATLSVHAQIKDKQVIAKHDLVIVKAGTITTGFTAPTSGKTYKCSFSNSTPLIKTDCSITSINTASESTLDALSFASITLTNSNQTTITKDKYYLLKWSTESFANADLKDKTIIFVEHEDASNKTSELAVQTPIFARIETGKQEVIILK